MCGVLVMEVDEGEKEKEGRELQFCACGCESHLHCLTAIDSYYSLLWVDMKLSRRNVVSVIGADNKVSRMAF